MSAFDAYMRLDGTIHGDVLVDESLKRHSSFRIGGPADLYITVPTYSDLTTTMEVLTEEEVPWVVLGRGTNILVHDEGYRGAVIVLGDEFQKFERQEDGRYTVGAGALLARVVQNAFNGGFSGLEFAVGIPGTMGGAISMNAGTRREWIGSVVEDVVTYRVGEGLVRYGWSDIGWYYRSNTLPPSELILETTLKLEEGDKDRIRERMEEMLSARRKAQPMDVPSAGSIFRNPSDASVGKMVEDLGLKGFSIGGAQVSPKHANFIVNTGGASASDVAKVLLYVRNSVKEAYGVELKPEIKFLGFPS